MNPLLDRNVVVERAFWVASALAVVGAVLPLLVGIGHPNRIAGVFFPFAVAAVAMGGLAAFYQRGKTVAALVYFLGGLAIAYGLLLALSVPMRLAVLGSCPQPPQPCNGSLELQLSGSESTGLTIAVAFGVMALFAGFVGLSVLYRQGAAKSPPPVWPDRPPEKPAAQVEPPPPPVAPPPPPPEPEPVAAEPEAAPPPPSRPRRKRAPKPAPEAPSEPEPPNA